MIFPGLTANFITQELLTMTSYAQKSLPYFYSVTFSHAIIIKQRNRNLCDTGSVRKSRKINGFTTTFRLHNGYNPSIEFIIIGQSRHEKDLVLCLMRILARCVEVLRQFDFPLKGRSELFEPRRGEFWAETLSFLGKADCLRTSASWHPATNIIPSLSHGPG